MISILKNNNITKQNTCDFVIDKENELYKVPKAARHGSTCLIIENGDIYILNGEKKWVKYNYNTSTDFNKIKQYIDDTMADIIIDSANIPPATQEKLGLVKGSNEINVTADGALSINKIDVEKIVATKETTIILDSGNSKY